MEWIDGLLAFAGIVVPTLFIHRQNKILERANELTAEAREASSSKPLSKVERAKRYWPMLAMTAMMVITWVCFGLGYLYKSEPPDARISPLESGDFFSGLPVDTSESFVMICFPYDPMSCNIAARYRDRLANHWTPASPSNVRTMSPFDGLTVFDKSNPASFKGIIILTQ
jgi:hypothetical protein